MHIISPSPFKQSVYAPSSAYGARRSEAHAVYIYVYMHRYIHIYIHRTSTGGSLLSFFLDDGVLCNREVGGPLKRA